MEFMNHSVVTTSYDRSLGCQVELSVHKGRITIDKNFTISKRSDIPLIFNCLHCADYLSGFRSDLRYEFAKTFGIEVDEHLRIVMFEGSQYEYILSNNLDRRIVDVIFQLTSRKNIPTSMTLVLVIGLWLLQ